MTFRGSGGLSDVFEKHVFGKRGTFFVILNCRLIFVQYVTRSCSHQFIDRRRLISRTLTFQTRKVKQPIIFYELFRS